MPGYARRVKRIVIEEPGNMEGDMISKNGTSKVDKNRSLETVKDNHEKGLDKFLVEVDYGLPISSKFFAARKPEVTFRGNV